ncbi:iron complex transport system substrate-binding protein [Granulicella pectinivorans]|uniref:Iron complex transport system substrate-binding protein n=1 Tax=Granulicella pectinivorans TaxID=474950 RepID=A0A1I6M328_9BACT|nr:cobalamin-binding protein [Granulicella pectinivorans]SFS10090.1 iron complex transport system substrate-binding protein [Granulicella pectinivorans]
MRICSLLPSATEILYALDLGDDVAGVTFECDYPAEARTKTILVGSVLHHGMTPEEIDREVSAHAARGESIYNVDVDRLGDLAPDLVITQELCDVCAVTPTHLAKALYHLPSRPEVVTLTPHTLDDVFADIETVGRAAHCEDRALHLVASLRARVEAIRHKVKRNAPRVACLEWLQPPFNAGHWVPEMVAIAGGVDGLGAPGAYSTRMEWEAVRNFSPDVVLVMPCGYYAQAAAGEYRAMTMPEWWDTLPAVKKGRVYAVNANAHFSRPGPRLVEGIEVMHALFQQDFSVPLPEGAWLQL